MEMKKNSKNQNNLIWTLDNIGTVLEIYELGLIHGKKAGDSLQEEFEEILKKKKEKFKLLGETDQDIDLLTGNLREQGLKILNFKELDRQKKKEEEN